MQTQNSIKKTILPHLLSYNSHPTREEMEISALPEQNTYIRILFGIITLAYRHLY